MNKHMQVMDPLKKKKELEEADEDLAVDSETSVPAHYANDKFAEAIDLTNHQANTKPDIDYEDQEQNVDLLPKAMETASPILETYPDPVEGDSDEEEEENEDEDAAPAIEPSSALEEIEEAEATTSELSQILSLAQVNVENTDEEDTMMQKIIDDLAKELGSIAAA